MRCLGIVAIKAVSFVIWPKPLLICYNTGPARDGDMAESNTGAPVDLSLEVLSPELVIKDIFLTGVSITPRARTSPGSHVKGTTE